MNSGPKPRKADISSASIPGFFGAAKRNGPDQSRGRRPNFGRFIVTAYTVTIGIPLTIFATLRWGVTGTIWSLVATNFGAAILWFVLAVRVMNIPPTRLCITVWRTIAALSVMVFAVWIVPTGCADGADAKLRALALTSKLFTGAVTYIGTHLGLWWLCGSPDGPERQALGAVLSKIGHGGIVSTS